MIIMSFRDRLKVLIFLSIVLSSFLLLLDLRNWRTSGYATGHAPTDVTISVRPLPATRVPSKNWEAFCSPVGTVYTKPEIDIFKIVRNATFYFINYNV